MAIAGAVMAKRKPKDEGEGPAGRTLNVNVRVPEQLVGRLDRAAEMLATDRSHLIRIILAEQVGVYEERGRRAMEGGGK
jgi:hypothetical protein